MKRIKNDEIRIDARGHPYGGFDLDIAFPSYGEWNTISTYIEKPAELRVALCRLIAFIDGEEKARNGL